MSGAGAKEDMVERKQETKKVGEEKNKLERSLTERSPQDKWQWFENLTTHTMLETVIIEECFTTL